MKLRVNGKDLETDATTVLELLNALGVAQAGSAVELNEEVVPRARHGVTALSAGDQIEIVSLVGGG